MNREEKQKKTHKGNIPQILKNNLMLLKIAFQEAPYYTLHRLMAVAKNRVIVFIEHVYMIGYIINAIVNKEPFLNVFAFILTVFICISLWVNVWGHIVVFRIEPTAKQKIDRRIRMALYRKAANMDLKCYDEPAFYTDFVWAMSEASTRIYKVIDTASKFIGSIISIAVVGGYMLRQDKFGLLFVTVSLVGIIFVSNIRNKINLDINERMKPWERKRDYISRVLYLQDYAKEIRLNNIKKNLFTEFNQTIARLDKESRKGSRAMAVCQFVTGFIFNTLIIDGFYLLYLLYLTIVKKVLGYGTMVTLYNSCNQIRSSFMQLSSAIPELQENSLYINKIRHFMDYPVEISSPGDPLPIPADTADIELKNVSFTYGKEKVLNHVSFKIKKGEKIAIVGYNGAGKTTIIKLLMRLYDVDEGEILYNGINIKDYALNDYQNIFGTVFQDYQLFAATVGENTVMDNVPVDESRADHAARRSGFSEKLKTFEKGYDTQVTKEFTDEGVLLSGGESQSLVIMRTLYKNSPIMILDEPSSALDPLMEYNLNKTMFELDSKKTVITISHRLSTTKIADRILMFEQGELIELGTHEELMSLNGKYAEMFTLQAEKYNLGHVFA